MNKKKGDGRRRERARAAVRKNDEAVEGGRWEGEGRGAKQWAVGLGTAGDGERGRRRTGVEGGGGGVRRGGGSADRRRPRSREAFFSPLNHIQRVFLNSMKRPRHVVRVTCTEKSGAEEGVVEPPLFPLSLSLRFPLFPAPRDRADVYTRRSSLR